MAYLVQIYSNSTTSYSGTSYQGLNGGTRKLYIRSGTSTSSYPLTTNTSASQYCKFTISTSNTTRAYLAKSISSSTTGSYTTLGTLSTNSTRTTGRYSSNTSSSVTVTFSLSANFQTYSKATTAVKDGKTWSVTGQSLRILFPQGSCDIWFTSPGWGPQAGYGSHATHYMENYYADVIPGAHSITYLTTRTTSVIITGKQQHNGSATMNQYDSGTYVRTDNQGATNHTYTRFSCSYAYSYQGKTRWYTSRLTWITGTFKGYANRLTSYTNSVKTTQSTSSHNINI